MKDIYKTKKELIKELIALHERVDGLQASELEYKQSYEKLCESEKNYRELVQNANSIILRMDVNGNLKLFNKFAQEFFGYKEEEILGRNVVDTIVPEKDLLQRDLSSLLIDFEKDPERYVYNEFENRRKNGERVWIAWNNKAVFNENGSITEIISIGNDITDRRQIEEELQNSEINYREIFNSANDAIFIHDIDSGKIIDVNQRFQEMFGYTSKTAQFLEVGDFSEGKPPFSTNDALQRIKNAETGKPQLFEWLGKDRTGRLFWVEANLKRTVIRGKPCILVVARDIDERKKVEDALRTSEANYRAIFNNVNDALFIHDAKTGKILKANDKFVEMFGYSQKEAEQKDVGRFSSGIDQYTQKHALQFIKKAARNEPQLFEWQCRHKSGRLFWLEVNLKQATIMGRDCLLAMARDISLRKEAERALAESEQKYKTLYESSQDAIMLLTPQKGFFSGNPATIEMFKCRDENEFNSKSSASLSPQYQPDGQLSSVKEEKMMAIAMKKGSHFFEWKHRKMDGAEFFSTVLLTRMELKNEKILQATVRDITELKLAEKAQKEYVRVLRRLSSKLISAQEDEKKRTARDIHDTIGQALTAIKFRVENTLQHIEKQNKKSIIKSLSEIIPIIQDTIEETRRVTMGLRPSTIDDLGIVATISWYCREFERIYPNISIEKHIDIDEADVPENLQITIYRILQESLHNIAKHSKADLARIFFQNKNNTIIFSVKDNGQGFNLDEAISMELLKRGHGLESMKERTELSGGSFFTESIRKAGTVVRACWPI